nr:MULTISPECIES: ribosome silencing factor [unclassified Rhizobium]
MLLKEGRALTTVHAKGRTPVVIPKSSERGADAAARALQAVLASLEDSKAENIVTIDIAGKSALGDHMVVVSGRSSRHVLAIADHVMTDLKDEGFGNARVEGLDGGDWVLIDTGDIIIHVFRPEIREFYNIEKMWAAPDLDEGTLH